MKKIFLLMLMLSPFTNAETKFFVCVDAITKELSVLLNDVLQINIDEEWMQFDEFWMDEEFLNDNFRQEVSASGYGIDGNGNRRIRWEFEFNKVTGAFKFISTELPSWKIDILSFICTPTEPLLP